MPDFEIEDSVNGVVAGVDEAGRGPWVGPVVAGCVVFLSRDVNPFLLENLNDSKKISKKKREQLYEVLLEEKAKGNILAEVGVASAKEIDEKNILNATFEAMKRAILNTGITPDFVLIDGSAFESSSKVVATYIDGKRVA